MAPRTYGKEHKVSKVRKCKVAIFDEDGYVLTGDATYTAVKQSEKADHAVVTVTFIQHIPKS